MRSSHAISLGMLACFVVLSSCNKVSELDAKRAAMDTERADLMAQMRELDATIKMPPAATRSAATMLNEAGSKNKMAEKLLPTASVQMKRWTAAEEALKELQERVRTYANGTN